MSDERQYTVGTNRQVPCEVLIDWSVPMQYVRLEPSAARLLATQLNKHAKIAEDARKKQGS